MPTRTQYDVAIVGASIAGCATAILFGRSGARVALIERDPDPAAYKKVCTHFIQPSATPTIERLGLAQPLEAAGAIRNEIELFSRWGWIVPPAPRTERPAHGYNIRRSTLDPIVRKTAAQTPGVDFMPGFSAHELLIDGGRISGVVIHGVGDVQHEIEAKLVVGADGRQSRIAELAGLPAKEKPNGRFFYFAHYRNLPLNGTRSQMWFLDPDMAYVFPNDDGVTLAAAMPARAKLAEWKADPEAALRRHFDGLPNAPRLADAQRVTPVMGIVEYPNLVRRRVFKPGLALIGDAAQCIDPLWGIGCGWAFQSAEWLADAVGKSWRSPGELNRNLANYARRHRRELAGHEFLISDYSTGRGFNPIERLMYSAAARDPVCADHFAAFGSRCIGVAAFLSPAALARAVWVNARHAMGAASRQSQLQ
jgi:flavin-dependent dehydrogenase